MHCTILLFAHLADVLGVDRLDVELPEGKTVAGCLDHLAATHDAIGAMRGRIAVAVNEKYAGSGTVLADGDVVALIPPVSGG